MNNTALITGASGGIGKELAYIHAEKNGDLVIVARSEDKLEAIKHEIVTKFSREVYIIKKDLTKPSAPLEIYKELQNENIKINYLINNAGFGGVGKFHERSQSNDLAMIQLNVTALTALTKLFLPDFVKADSGKVLNVSSTASFLPGPLQAVYFATKAYVSSFSNAIAYELRNTNVTVTTLLPGATETEFATTADLEDSKLFNNPVSPKKVAEIGYSAMIHGEREVMAGVSTLQKILLRLILLLPYRTKMRIVERMHTSHT